MAGRNDNMKAMLEKVPQGGDALNLKIQDAQNTPLHTAAAFGKRGIAKLLFKHGADLEIQNAAAQTPLDVAGVHMGARGKDAFKSWFETASGEEETYTA